MIQRVDETVFGIRAENALSTFRHWVFQVNDWDAHAFERIGQIVYFQHRQANFDHPHNQFLDLLISESFHIAFLIREILQMLRNIRFPRLGLITHDILPGLPWLIE